MRVRDIVLSAFPTAALAAQLTVNIPASNYIPNPSTLPPSTHAVLASTGEPYRASLTRRNTFEFDNLRPGSYLLTVHCRDFAFETQRVDVSDSDSIEVVTTFRGNEWDNKGEKRGQGNGNAVADIKALGPKEYYLSAGGFSPLAFLKSPMILMALFSLAVIVGMPYLMDNLDPEVKAEFEEMQKSNPMGANPVASAQNFDFAGWMAGKASGADAAKSGGDQKRR